MVHEKVDFIHLSDKMPNTLNPSKNTKSICNPAPILIEMGTYKMYVPEEMAMTFLLQVMEMGGRDV